jgi:hypothetical protein
MPQEASKGKTIREPARDIKVCREADVVVVGGGREASAPPWRPHEQERIPSFLAMCYWVANVDPKKLNEFREKQPQKFAEQGKEITKSRTVWLSDRRQARRRRYPSRVV